MFSRLQMGLRIGAPAALHPQLETAARSLPISGPSVEVEHARRWTWVKPEYIRTSILEAGGCACGLLTDAADREARYWSLHKEILEPSASMLHGIASAGIGEFTVKGLWNVQVESESFRPGFV